MRKSVVYYITKDVFSFSGIVRYGDHLKAGGDDVSKRASTLRESVQDVLAMFHEIENTKIDVKESKY